MLDVIEMVVLLVAAPAGVAAVAAAATRRLLPRGRVAHLPAAAAVVLAGTGAGLLARADGWAATVTVVAGVYATVTGLLSVGVCVWTWRRAGRPDSTR
jgi:hypothetical protein